MNFGFKGSVENLSFYAHIAYTTEITRILSVAEIHMNGTVMVCFVRFLITVRFSAKRKCMLNLNNDVTLQKQA